MQSVLTVYNVTESDLGIYTCNVQNKFGNSNDMITVNVDIPSITGKA